MRVEQIIQRKMGRAQDLIPKYTEKKEKKKKRYTQKETDEASQKVRGKSGECGRKEMCFKKG